MTVLPKLTSAQARELRAVAAGETTVVHPQVIRRIATVGLRLVRYGKRGWEATPHGRAWLAANPDGKA